jgi:hypothetical protein
VPRPRRTKSLVRATVDRLPTSARRVRDPGVTYT